MPLNMTLLVDKQVYTDVTTGPVKELDVTRDKGGQERELSGATSIVQRFSSFSTAENAWISCIPS